MWLLQWKGVNVTSALLHPEVLLRQTGDRSCSTGLCVFVCLDETSWGDDMSVLMAWSVVFCCHRNSVSGWQGHRQSWTSVTLTLQTRVSFKDHRTLKYGGMSSSRVNLDNNDTHNVMLCQMMSCSKYALSMTLICHHIKLTQCVETYWVIAIIVSANVDGSHHKLDWLQELNVDVHTVTFSVLFIKYVQKVMRYFANKYTKLTPKGYCKVFKRACMIR